MSKTFFIIVPYTPGATLQMHTGLLSKLFGGKTKKNLEVDRVRFEEHRTQLEQRINVVESGLVRTGVRTAVLGTEELVELFFKIFNPGEVVKPITQQ